MIEMVQVSDHPTIGNLLFSLKAEIAAAFPEAGHAMVYLDEVRLPLGQVRLGVTMPDPPGQQPARRKFTVIEGGADGAG